MDNKHKIDFKEIVDRIDSLKLGRFDLVVGIATGGIVPASLIAYKLRIELKLIPINFRNEDNKPVRDVPSLLNDFELHSDATKILLVDDVSVTGSTINTAKKFLIDRDVTSLVLKGNADIVLFPNINTCVDWPWKRF